MFEYISMVLYPLNTVHKIAYFFIIYIVIVQYALCKTKEYGRAELLAIQYLHIFRLQKFGNNVDKYSVNFIGFHLTTISQKKIPTDNETAGIIDKWLY